MVNKGLVFGIQHFSIHDGPGIRSNVFLKGCSLRCRWCHNPEGLSAHQDVQYFSDKCTHCGRCNYMYKNLKNIDNFTDVEKNRLVDRCTSGALQMVGAWMSVEEIIEEVIKDKVYFDASHGGMTISGGEPMMHPEFVLELCKLAKVNGISVAIETSGYTNCNNLLEILPYIDCFLWDYKATSSYTHKILTGVDNSLILNNLDCLYKKGANIILRCPLIPNVNDTEDHLQGIAKMHMKYPGLKGIEIMPYHKMGVSKAKRVNVRQTQYKVPDLDYKNQWKRKIESFGGYISKVN